MALMTLKVASQKNAKSTSTKVTKKFLLTKITHYAGVSTIKMEMLYLFFSTLWPKFKVQSNLS